MLLLITYVLVALVFSFLCSVAEAVLLSVTDGYVAVLEGEGKAAGRVLRRLKQDVNKPLAAILTLNTVAHTVGAAGAGAQAALVFGEAWLGAASAVLTLLILVLSEIIPKTLGARHWRALAPATAWGLRFLVWVLHPFVKLSGYLTRSMAHGPMLTGFSRAEFAAMAELSQQQGVLARSESQILRSVLALHGMKVRDAMTPRTVVFAIPESMSVGEFCEQHATEPFSRIPVYRGEKGHITGFVLRADLLLAQARGETSALVSAHRRDIPALPGVLPLSRAFDELLQRRTHILVVIDEYGGTDGILTLEDVIETMLGLEIVDEADRVHDMQALARRLWRRRAEAMGLATEEQHAQPGGNGDTSAGDESPMPPPDRND
jgi:CBS domain containing-hemolysin-like protein